MKPLWHLSKRVNPNWPPYQIAAFEVHTLLKESEEIFSSVAHYSPVPLAIIEPDGTYRYINQKFTETFGYDLNDFRNGHEWFSLAYPDPSYRKKVIDAWKSDLRTYKSGIERPRRFTVRCKNGSDREIVNRLHNCTQLMQNDYALILLTYFRGSRKIRVQLGCIHLMQNDSF